jgi:hypothetical protein
MAFEPKPLELETPKPIYSHGYSEEQERHIREQREKIFKRDLSVEPVTTEELRDVIIPYQRIIRTEAFILNPKKEEKEKKVREPKVPKEKKPKKLTKKFIQEELNRITMKELMQNEPLTEEEQKFYEEHMPRDIL